MQENAYENVREMASGTKRTKYLPILDKVCTDCTVPLNED